VKNYAVIFSTIRSSLTADTTSSVNSFHQNGKES